MEEAVKKEVERLIKTLNLSCSVEKFKEKVDWYDISKH